MPSRINHVKVVTPNPAVVNAFLTQVCDVPQGWPLSADVPALGPEEPLGPGGELGREVITERQRAGGSGGRGAGGGFIAGDPSSRQFQIFSSDHANFWAVCISTRYVEDVYERAVQRGVQCTPIDVADWNERDNIRNFFCIVDGLMFEVIRVEPKET